MNILSIRFQIKPFWIIKSDNTSTNLDICEDDLENTDGSLDFKSWIKDNKDKYKITHIIDENWIQNNLPYDINNPMKIEDYLNIP